MKLPYDAILFDFDGVILDTMGIKTEAFKTMFSSYGTKVVNKVIEYHIKNGGISRQKKFKYFYENFLMRPLSDEELNELCSTFSDLVLQKTLDAPWIAGVQDFLESNYKDNDFFIISGIPQDELDFIVSKRGLKKYFKEVQGSPKSKVDSIKDIVSRYYYRPPQTLYIGDSLSDWVDAQLAGINFLGLTSEPKFPNGTKTIKDFTGELDALQS